MTQVDLWPHNIGKGLTLMYMHEFYGQIWADNF